MYASAIHDATGTGVVEPVDGFLRIPTQRLHETDTASRHALPTGIGETAAEREGVLIEIGGFVDIPI